MSQGESIQYWAKNTVKRVRYKRELRRGNDWICDYNNKGRERF